MAPNMQSAVKRVQDKMVMNRTRRMNVDAS